MSNILELINTRILIHCAAAIVTTLLVSWLEVKPYGVLFLMFFILWVYKTSCAASIKIISPPELNAIIHYYYNKSIELREDHPTIFCILISSVLFILAFIGHILSGANVVLIGLMLSALVSTKYNFKILKVQNKEKLSSWSSLTTNTDNDVDEFLPEVNDANLFVLQRASDQALITAATATSSNDGSISTAGDDEDKSDEIPSELLIPDSIPEIDENTDSSSEDELIPKIPEGNSSQLHLQQKHKNHNKQNDAEDNNLEFKKGYFKKDSSISTSSSSDDESLSKGLNFNDYTIVDGKNSFNINNQQSKTQNQLITTAGTTVTSILPNLVTGLISTLNTNKNDKKQHQYQQQQQQPEQYLDTSDESDFEILNTDDLNHP